MRHGARPWGHPMLGPGRQWMAIAFLQNHGMDVGSSIRASIPCSTRDPPGMNTAPYDRRFPLRQRRLDSDQIDQVDGIPVLTPQAASEAAIANGLGGTMIEQAIANARRRELISERGAARLRVQLADRNARVNGAAVATTPWSSPLSLRPYISARSDGFTDLNCNQLRHVSASLSY